MPHSLLKHDKSGSSDISSDGMAQIDKHVMSPSLKAPVNTAIYKWQKPNVSNWLWIIQNYNFVKNGMAIYAALQLLNSL